MFLSFLLIILFNQYSVITPQNEPTYFVDDFEMGLTDDWKGRHAGHETIYQIRKEKDNQFLAAISANSDNLIVKQIEVDLVEYPYLNWKWRATTLPKNGDESVKANCDVAASIAVILNTNRFFPKSIKYSWSTTLEKDSLTESPFAFWPSSCDIRVMESGAQNLGKWQTEKINVLADYQQFNDLQKVDTKLVYAIVIMTDSDNTETLSAANYDDIYFSKN